MTSLRKTLSNAREYANNLNQLDDIQKTLTTLKENADTDYNHRFENGMESAFLIEKKRKLLYRQNILVNRKGGKIKKGRKTRKTRKTRRSIK